jgi:hypothetical protein
VTCCSHYLLESHLHVRWIFPYFPHFFCATCIRKFSLLLVWWSTRHWLCNLLDPATAACATNKSVATCDRVHFKMPSSLLLHCVVWQNVTEISDVLAAHHLDNGSSGHLQEGLSDVRRESQLTVKCNRNRGCDEVEWQNQEIYPLQFCIKWFFSFQCILY